MNAPPPGGVPGLPYPTGGIDLVLAHLRAQDEAIAQVRALAADTLAEARATNGRVRVLEEWVAHHDGVTEADARHQADEAAEADAEAARRRGRRRAIAQFIATLVGGLAAGVGVAVIVNLLIGGSP